MKPLRIVAGLVVTILLASSGHAERVGLTQTWVDNARPPAYRIEGGTDEFHATGEVCNLMQAFVVEAGSVKIKFTPKSNRKGRYDYAGKIDGVDVTGRGTYVVEYEDRVAISIVASEFFYRLKQVPGACRG